MNGPMVVETPIKSHERNDMRESDRISARTTEWMNQPMSESASEPMNK
jgi:hypothetical protein